MLAGVLQQNILAANFIAALVPIPTALVLQHDGRHSENQRPPHLSHHNQTHGRGRPRRALWTRALLACPGPPSCARPGGAPAVSRVAWQTGIGQWVVVSLRQGAELREMRLLRRASQLKCTVFMLVTRVATGQDMPLPAILHRASQRHDLSLPAPVRAIRAHQGRLILRSHKNGDGVRQQTLDSGGALWPQCRAIHAQPSSASSSARATAHICRCQYAHSRALSSNPPIID
jgi:hypothetical protein